MALSHGLCICNRWHCFMMKWLDGLQIMYWEKQAACILEFRELGEAAEMGILMLCEENWFGKLSRPLPTEKYREEGKWLSIQIIQDIVLAILFIFLALNGLWEKQKELYTLSTELLRGVVYYNFVPRDEQEQEETVTESVVETVTAPTTAKVWTPAYTYTSANNTPRSEATGGLVFPAGICLLGGAMRYLLMKCGAEYQTCMQ